MDMLEPNEIIQDYYVRSNSPISDIMVDPIANTTANITANTTANTTDILDNSIHEREHNSSSDDEIDKQIQNRENFQMKHVRNNKLDILMTFIKGQKHLYNHCNRVCQTKSNMLLIPCMCISSLNAILSSIFQNEEWTNAVSSTLNTVLLLMISMSSYFKFEASSDAFLRMYQNFDRLENSIKQVHNSVVTYQHVDSVNEKIKDIESRLMTLKENNIPVIPDESRDLFPVICQVNISSLIRKMETYRSQLYSNFADLKNEIRFLLLKKPIFDDNNSEIQGNTTMQNLKVRKEQSRLIFLYEEKERIKKELSSAENLYDYIDTIFSKEIRHANRHSVLYSLFSCMFCLSITRPSYEGLHPVIDQYFAFVFGN